MAKFNVTAQIAHMRVRVYFCDCMYVHTLHICVGARVCVCVPLAPSEIFYRQNPRQQCAIVTQSSNRGSFGA